MGKYSVALATAVVAATLQMGMAPAAQADICGDAGGPYVNAGGCLPPGALQEGAAIAGSFVVADALDEARQRAQGRPPCYTREGVPYYTPGDAPCA